MIVSVCISLVEPDTVRLRHLSVATHVLTEMFDSRHKGAHAMIGLRTWSSARVQIEDLYEDFHITKLPLMEHEVRGADQIHKFSNFLMHQYDPNVHKPSLVG